MHSADKSIAMRLATLEDVAILEEIIAASVRVLQASEYSFEQREAALRTVYGVDTQLIRDGTYFAVEDDGQIVACGGWSRRKTLYGGDRHAVREDSLLDPQPSQPEFVLSSYGQVTRDVVLEVPSCACAKRPRWRKASLAWKWVLP